MEEQVARRQPSTNTGVPLYLLIAIVLAVVLASLVIWKFFAGSPDPAVFIPKDVAMAVTFDVRSTADKNAAVKYLETLLKQAGIRDPQEKTIEELNDALGVDVAKELTPKLNGVGAAAVSLTLTASSRIWLPWYAPEPATMHPTCSS